MRRMKSAIGKTDLTSFFGTFILLLQDSARC